MSSTRQNLTIKSKATLSLSNNWQKICPEKNRPFSSEQRQLQGNRMKWKPKQQSVRLECSRRKGIYCRDGSPTYNVRPDKWCPGCHTRPNLCLALSQTILCDLVDRHNIAGNASFLIQLVILLIQRSCWRFTKEAKCLRWVSLFSGLGAVSSRHVQCLLCFPVICRFLQVSFLT